MTSWFLVLVVIVTLKETIASSWNCGTCTCSRHNGVQYMNCRNQQLTSLPYPVRFKENIPTSVYIVDNTITSIRSDLFLNFTKIKVVFVSLRNNSIRNISENVFTYLPHLKGLDLSWNSINLGQAEKALQGINNADFNRLNMSHMNIRHIPDNIFKPFEISKKLNISLHHNYLTSLNQKAIDRLPGIHLLDLASNRLSYFSFNITFICNITILKMDNNVFNSFPNLCKNRTESYFPNLEKLSFQWNFMRNITPSSFICLRNVKRFQLNGNLFSTLVQNAFAGLQSIERITLSESFALQHVGYSPFNNTNLKSVFFRKNFLYTENPYHSLDLFEGCSSMELLNMADNILDKTTDEEFERLFRPLKNLRTLIMGGCRLNRIPPAVMKYLVNLRELVLYNNRIGTWPDGTLYSLTKLDTIYMRQNEITTISEFTFPPNFSRIAYKVDLSENPFQCTCDLRWFIDWMKKHPEIFEIAHFTTNYKCMSPVSVKNLRLKDLPLSDSICLLDLNSKIITLTGATMLIVFMVVGSMLYRYRWHIRYFIYMIRYKQRQDVDTGLYEYDAFVAYSNEDRPWVIKTLMPVLEHQASFKLCIHDRDFEVGKLIVDNIVDSIDNSRSLIIILSNTFAKSDWCQFELALIQRHVLENRQRLLVLVMLEEIDTRHVTKSIRAMLQTTTYLLWGEEEYARKAFFNRLRMLLRKPNNKAEGRRLSV